MLCFKLDVFRLQAFMCVTYCLFLFMYFSDFLSMGFDLGLEVALKL
jgi:hypothetical protein